MNDFGTLTFIVRLCLGFASTLFVTSLPVAHASQCLDPYQPNCDDRGVHHVVRRSASSSVSQSLQVDFVPRVQNVTYYNKDNEISFSLNLTHNQSVSADMTTNLKVVITSQFLEPKSGSLVQNSSISNAILNSSAISFDVTSLPSAQVLSVSFIGIVKGTIHPLANLYFVVHVTGSDGSNDYHFGPVPSLPTLYAVFPKVSLSRDSYSHLWVSNTTCYTMTITMPKLNFSLLVEISTAINDFSFMELTNVLVASVGTNINIGSGGGTKFPSPQYDASEGVSFSDRTVLDFGNLTVAGHEAINNRIVIKYNVTIRDHPMLANNSKHWVGAGMRSGYQMLWVGQEALYVYKNEPSITGEVEAMNDTTNKRYLIGDRLYVNWTVSHMYNTSYEDAQDVSVTFYSNTLKLISGTYEESADAGTPKKLLMRDMFRSGTINITALAKGNTIHGTLELEVSELISPLESLDVFMELRYKNIRGEEKMNTTHKVSPPYVAGVPVFSLKLNSSTSQIRIGGRAKFYFSVVMRNMISTIKVEVILPVNDSSSVMSLTYGRVLSVGSKIENHTTHIQTQPQFASTVGDPKLYDRATVDFGTVKSVTTEGNAADHEILIEFEVIVNDHTNVTNGSKHWVGVGVRGGETMMWIGEVALIADVPADRRPVLQVQGSCEVPGSQLSCKDATMLERNSKVYFNGTVFHDERSQQYADNVKILWMIPPYVTFDKLHNDPGMSYETTNGGPRFTFDQKLHFLDRLTFSGEGSLDPKGIMPPGDTYAVSPIQLTYSPYSMSAVFGAPLAPISFKFRSPGEGEPTETLGHLQEEYNRGFLFDTTGNTVYICQKSNDRLKSSCFSTADGSSWMAMDQQVCSIIGQYGSFLYAIACNGRAYMERKGMNGAWYGISQQKWKNERTQNPNIQQNLRTIPDDYASDEITPSDDKTVGSAIQWGATMKGVSMKDSGIWQLKAQWKCCGS